MSSNIQYMTFPGAAHSGDQLALPQTAGRSHPQNFRGHCGRLLIAAGTLGVLAGTGLAIQGSAKFKAFPFLSNPSKLGLGIALIIVGCLMIGSGICLLKKSPKETPSRVLAAHPVAVEPSHHHANAGSMEDYIREHGFCRAWETYVLAGQTSKDNSGEISQQWLLEINKPGGVKDTLLQARRSCEFDVECAEMAYHMDVGNADRNRRAVTDPLRKRIDELQAELGRVNAEYDKALVQLEAPAQSNAERCTVAVAEYRRATSELKHHLEVAKDQWRRHAPQAFADCQRTQQAAQTRLAAAKQQAEEALARSKRQIDADFRRWYQRP